MAVLWKAAGVRNKDQSRCWVEDLGFCFGEDISTRCTANVKLEAVDVLSEDWSVQQVAIEAQSG
jgi:hypothetical protein